MNFRIQGLPVASFSPLFGLPDAELAQRGALRVVADSHPGYPDRIEMRDAEPGESLLLLNHVHHDVINPYRASHAIYVLEGARRTYDVVDEVPECMRRRLLSLRAFDARGFMVAAEVVEGRAVETAIDSLFANPDSAELHAHYAKPGCFAARILRL